MIQLGVISKIPIYLSDATYYRLENLLTKNWNKNNHRIFELCDLWRKRIEECLISISNVNDADFYGEDLFVSVISEGIGDVYYKIFSNGTQLCIGVVAFDFNLPWYFNDKRFKITESLMNLELINEWFSKLGVEPSVIAEMKNKQKKLIV